MKSKKFLDPEKRGENICPRLYVVRGVEVMLDSDLARLFKTTTKYLNQVVKRHGDRFPKEFMFKVKGEEFENLRWQIATSYSRQGYGEGQGHKDEESYEDGHSHEDRQRIVNGQRHTWEDRRGGRRHLPYVFTGHGVEELATLLGWDLED